MDWEERLNSFKGRTMEVRIEDQAGIDPMAPPITRTLHHVRLSDEKTHLQFYFDETQHLSIPIFNDERTRLKEQTDATVFLTHDEDAKLIYKLRFQQ